MGDSPTNHVSVGQSGGCDGARCLWRVSKGSRPKWGVSIGFGALGRSWERDWTTFHESKWSTGDFGLAPQYIIFCEGWAKSWGAMRLSLWLCWIVEFRVVIWQLWPQVEFRVLDPQTERCWVHDILLMSCPNPFGPNIFAKQNALFGPSKVWQGFASPHFHAASIRPGEGMMPSLFDPWSDDMWENSPITSNMETPGLDCELSKLTRKEPGTFSWNCGMLWVKNYDYKTPQMDRAFLAACLGCCLLQNLGDNNSWTWVFWDQVLVSVVGFLMEIWYQNCIPLFDGHFGGSTPTNVGLKP